MLPRHRVLHIGAGTGYYTAILAELVGPSGRITAVEIDPELAAIARENLKPWANVEVVCGDGADWPMTAVDRIYVNFAVAEPAKSWLDHLMEDGRLIFPLGVCTVRMPEGRPRHSTHGGVLSIIRKPAGYAAKWLCSASFVCSEGALTANGEDQFRLRQAFERGGMEFVGSLQWGKPTDPSRSWFWTPRWSLSFDRLR